MRPVAVVVALLSGLCALSILALPLLLVLLMVLFDSLAHGLLVLLGMLVTWASALLRGGGSGLPSYSAIVMAPLPVALHAALQSAPCLGGLILVLLRPRPGKSWWLVALLWCFSAGIGGELVSVTLLPGIAIAAWFALHRAGSVMQSSAIRITRRRKHDMPRRVDLDQQPGSPDRVEHRHE